MHNLNIQYPLWFTEVTISKIKEMTESKPETQLPADDFSVCVVPFVITDGPPLASVVQLHPTFMPAVPTSKADDGQQRACVIQN